MSAPPSFVPAGAPGQETPTSFQPESPDAAGARALETKYGGGKQELATGLLGALDTASFGGASQIAVAEAGQPIGPAPGDPLYGFFKDIGLAGNNRRVATPEQVAKEIEASDRANPKSKLAGSVAGLLLGGAGSAVGKAGTAAAEGIGAALPQASSLLGRAGVGLARGVASGATEGGLLTVGNLIKEEALGDPNFTAQAAAEELGLGVFGGSLLGGGMGALGGLTKGIGGSNLGQKLAEWLPDFEGERVIKAAGATQQDIARAENVVGKDELRALAREGGEKGLVEKFDTPASVFEKSKAFKDEAGQRIAQLTREADMAGVAPRPMAELAADARKEILAPLEKNPLEKGTASQFRGMLDDYEKLYGQEGETLGAQGLHGIRKNIDDKLFGLKGLADPNATAMKVTLRKFRGIVSEELQNALTSRSAETGAAWKTANRDFQIGATLQRFAEKGIQRATGNNMLSLTEQLGGMAGFMAHGIPGGALAGLASAAVRRHSASLLASGARGLREYLEAGAPGNIPETVAALSHLESANKAVAARIDGLAAKLFDSAPRAAPITSALAAGSAHERMAQFQSLAQNPEALHELLVANAADLNEHAPNTAQAMQVQRAQQVAFLASKAPPQPKAGPLGPALKPNKEQQWKFARYYDAVNEPTSILKRAAAGTLTPMDVEAVRETAPQLYQSMVTAALAKATAHKGQLPYRSRQALALLTGQDMDGTMKPESIQANQLAYQMPSQKGPMDQTGPGATGKSTQGGLSKLKTASRSMLPGQGAEARRGEM